MRYNTRAMRRFWTGWGVLCLVLGLAVSVARARDDLQDGIKNIARGLTKDLTKPGLRVAVLPFTTLKGTQGEFGRYLVEGLLTQLVATRKVDVIERAQLEKVLGEMKLGMTGTMDAESVKQVGKILGAELVCTGTYTDQDEEVSVMARLIETQTGRIASALQSQIKADRQVRRMLSEEPVQSAPALVQATPAPGAPASAASQGAGSVSATTRRAGHVLGNTLLVMSAILILALLVQPKKH